MSWFRVPLRLTATCQVRWSEVAVLGFTAALFLALGVGPAIGQAIDTKLASVTDAGGVNDIVRAGNTIYLGGSFLQVGPWTGQGVPVSATTGRPAGTYPLVVGGEVAVAAADGHQGWFVGGSFTRVGGRVQLYLAHILADGSLSAWNPELNAPVDALCLSNDTLFVGGAFTACGGVNRRRGAAFDVRTGRLTDWDPKADGAIKTIATDGSLVYVGGLFSMLDTLQRANLAAVHRGAGAATDWNPGADSVVLALAVHGEEVYAGGYFHQVGGASRSLIAAIDRTSGAVLPSSWTIVRTPACDRCDAGPFVDVMAIDGGRLYLGGSFTHVDGYRRSGAAAIELSSHELSDWDPQLTGTAPFPYCRAIGVSQGLVYLGGQFDGLKGIVQPRAGAVDTNGVLAAWNPRPNASVSCVAIAGTTAYIGGDFSSTWSWQPRRFLAAVDASTGEVTPWNPSPDNVVGQIRVSENTVYVAGAFETIAGQPRTCLAALDAQSGEATPWNPGVVAGIYPPIRDMVVRHGIVYVAGLFFGLGGQARYCLGAIDSVTGRATSWSPRVDDFVQTMAMQGDTLYLGGWFSQVAGVPRNFLAAVDTSGNLLDWNPDPDDMVKAMTIAEGRVFIGGFFSHVAGLPRSTLAAIDCATGAVTDWVADATPPQVRSLAVANHVLYAGGWFRQVAGETRNGLAAIDTQTGALLSWNPQPDPGYVSALHVFGDALYVGGSFDYLGSELRRGLAAISLARGADPGPVPPPGHSLAIAQNVPNPVRTSTTIRFGLSAPARVTLSVFDLAGRCIATPLKDDGRTAGSHAVEFSAAGWPSGMYYYRLDAAGATAVRKMLVVK